MKTFFKVLVAILVVFAVGQTAYAVDTKAPPDDVVVVYDVVDCDDAYAIDSSAEVYFAQHRSKTIWAEINYNDIEFSVTSVNWHEPANWLYSSRCAVSTKCHKDFCPGFDPIKQC
jgi:hypothetical protein